MSMCSVVVGVLGSLLACLVDFVLVRACVCVCVCE